MVTTLMFLLLQVAPAPLPAAPSPPKPAAQVWLESAYREGRELAPEQRVHALQRLSVAARKIAPPLAPGYFREAFQAANDVTETDRRGRIQYQLVRDVAQAVPERALGLALEMGDFSSGSIDWRVAAGVVALDAWIERNPAEAAQGIERLYAAGINNLQPATHLIRSLKPAQSDLAAQVFDRSVALYRAAPGRDVAMIIELIFQSQAMLSLSRESALKTIRALVGDINELARSEGDAASAALGLRALALDTLRQVSPEEAEKLAQADAETADILKQMPPGFSTPAETKAGDPAPGIEPAASTNVPEPAQDPAEERQVMLAVQAFSTRQDTPPAEGQWTEQKLLELEGSVQAPINRARIRVAVAIARLSAEDPQGESAVRDALAAIDRLYDSEPAGVPPGHRRSTGLYIRVIGQVARANADRALQLVHALPDRAIRFEVLLTIAPLLMTAGS